jgi:hypothetical protein
MTIEDNQDYSKVPQTGPALSADDGVFCDLSNCSTQLHFIIIIDDILGLCHLKGHGTFAFVCLYFSRKHLN